MRLLHTSDWHLGRTLHRADLRQAQAAYLDHLVETVRSERIDAVLVSGDVYDRAIPPVDAVALCEDGLFRLRDAGARVVVISGNHDSARRLGFASALVDAAGVYLRTRAGALAQPVLLADGHGPVAVYGVPFLEPDAVRADLPPAPGEEAVPRGHVGVLTRATDCIRADIGERGLRSVVMAHAWVAGGEASESERDISVGGVGRVPVSLFDGFSYTALGHLHGPQTLRENLRYSGSPLPYSFSEARQPKGSWLVDLGPDGQVQAERVPAPSFRRLSVLRGTLDTLLTSPAHTECEDDFVSVVLTDTARPEGAMDKLRRRFPHVLVLAFEPEGREAGAASYRARVAGRDDLAIAAEFVGHVCHRPVTAGERQLLTAAFDDARRAEGDEDAA
ncbi:MAG TPA: exonuclease SbcCD subunit D [Streptosporangiaceae bacterium]|nr:exonuclease SbcCD subunit D [Streptosporangiaceae bacterium]